MKSSEDKRAFGPQFASTYSLRLTAIIRPRGQIAGESQVIFTFTYFHGNPRSVPRQMIRQASTMQIPYRKHKYGKIRAPFLHMLIH